MAAAEAAAPVQHLPHAAAVPGVACAAQMFWHYDGHQPPALYIPLLLLSSPDRLADEAADDTQQPPIQGYCQAKAEFARAIGDPWQKGMWPQHKDHFLRVAMMCRVLVSLVLLVVADKLPQPSAAMGSGLPLPICTNPPLPADGSQTHPSDD